ncbi:MAG: ribosomal protein S18-alanine N-acetyltransferase [Cyanobacteria bacterium P01_E01_bin.34]
MLETIRLLQLGLDHLDALEQLESLCLGAWTRDGLEVELTRPPRDVTNPDRPSSYVIGAWSGDSPAVLVGFAALWAIGAEAHITTLGVHPDYRRQGIGRQLVEQLSRIAVEQQLGWTTLEVRASNYGAIALYECLGFKPVGQRKRYYSNPEEDGLILWKQLGDNL